MRQQIYLIIIGAAIGFLSSIGTTIVTEMIKIHKIDGTVHIFKLIQNYIKKVSIFKNFSLFFMKKDLEITIFKYIDVYRQQK